MHWTARARKRLFPSHDREFYPYGVIPAWDRVHTIDLRLPSTTYNQASLRYDWGLSFGACIFVT
jgi:hypothetical protein